MNGVGVGFKKRDRIVGEGYLIRKVFINVIWIFIVIEIFENRYIKIVNMKWLYNRGIFVFFKILFVI